MDGGSFGSTTDRQKTASDSYWFRWLDGSAWWGSCFGVKIG